MVQFKKHDAKIYRLGAHAIYERLRDQVVSGVYAVGEKIPSTRSLAKELGVSRTTVCVAYDQLAAEGFISVSQGAQPRVAVTFPSAEEPRTDQVDDTAIEAPLSRYGRHLLTIGSLPQPSSKNVVVNFRYGEVASADFPSVLWRQAMMRALSRKSKVLAYGEPEGTRALRRALQGYLWRARSISCRTDQIIIVSGSQQALDLLGRLLLNEDGSFVIENPSYAMARLAFETTGASAIPIEVDSSGLDTSRLGDISAQLAYVTPSHQYPLGGILPIERRLSLIAWAKRTNAWIIEDDYDSEYRYDMKPLPPLWSVDDSGRVIYIGTVSKILSPTLRIGYVVVPDSLVAIFKAAKQLADRHTPLLEQDALAGLIQSGAYERHVRRQRRLNQKRRQTLIAALRTNFGTDVDIEGTSAGLHLVVWFRHLPAASEDELIERARSLGVGVYSVRPLCDPPLSTGRNEQIGLVLGYASLDPEWITYGITLLRKAIAEMEFSG